MKLTTRILLGSIAILLSAIALCCSLILLFTRKQMESDALTKAVSDFRTSVSSMMPHYEPYDDPAAEYAFWIYRIQHTAFSPELTLFDGETYLINNTGFAPEALFDSTEPFDNQNMISKIRRLFGSTYAVIRYLPFEFGEKTYSVCFVRKLSELDSAMRKLTLRCVAVSLGVSLLFPLLLYGFCTISLKPIKELQKSTAAIASGRYDTRIRIRRKDEIGALAADFNGMADAVQNSIRSLTEENARKQRFINDLSHEMKTPVTSLMLNSETLLNRVVSEADRQNALLRIHEQAKWIERLSGKLMQLVLLQNETELLPRSVAALFDAVHETTADSLHAARMDLLCTCSDETLPMDFDLMRSALVNLVENAIKASEPNGTVELIAKDRSIAVRDHGRGIGESDLAHVTEPFYMVDKSRSKKQGGSGLGLALVKRIVEAHHATLCVESALGVGTTVRIVFPDPE